VTQEYLDMLAAVRSDNAKTKTGKKTFKPEDTVIGLHNGVANS
jgi:hypothetical protein